MYLIQRIDRPNWPFIFYINKDTSTVKFEEASQKIRSSYKTAILLPLQVTPVFVVTIYIMKTCLFKYAELLSTKNDILYISAQNIDFSTRLNRHDKILLT